MTDRNVLITGVHRGLGHELASLCLERGWNVYGVSRRVPGDLVGRGTFTFQQADLAEHARIPAVLEDLLGDVRHLHLVILNAGILGGLKDLRDTSLSELKLVMDLNVWANKMIIDALMVDQRRVDQVVAVSSGAAFNGSGGWGGYSISKSALNLMIRVYADEHPDTHFATLAPGIVLTDMVQEVLDTRDNPRWPAVARIRQARDESQIREPAEAARIFLDAVPRLLSTESGSFSDVRKM